MAFPLNSYVLYNVDFFPEWFYMSRIFIFNVFIKDLVKVRRMKSIHFKGDGRGGMRVPLPRGKIMASFISQFFFPFEKCFQQFKWGSLLCNLKIGFHTFEMALFHFRNAEINIKVAEISENAEIAEIARKVPC